MHDIFGVSSPSQRTLADYRIWRRHCCMNSIGASVFRFQRFFSDGVTSGVTSWHPQRGHFVEDQHPDKSFSALPLEVSGL